jgi:hypothetical protein
VLTFTNETDQLAAAMAAAQSEMQPAEKDLLNPHYGHTYAGLAAIWKVCRLPLTKNGIAIIQGVDSIEDGRAVTETLVLHKSGQRAHNICTLPVTQKTAQAYGSAFSYGRRYSLASMAGVVMIDEREDDDGEAARRTAQEDKAIRARKTPPPKEQPKADLPWANKEELEDAFNHLKPFVSEATYRMILDSNQISIKPDGHLHGTKAGYIAAYAELEKVIALSEKPDAQGE